MQRPDAPPAASGRVDRLLCRHPRCRRGRSQRPSADRRARPRVAVAMPAPSTTLPAVAPTREVVATLAPPATAPAVAPARAIVATPAPPAAPSTVSREIQWQTITLPPPRDFSRRSDPAPGVPRNEAVGGCTEAAARSLMKPTATATSPVLPRVRTAHGTARHCEAVPRRECLSTRGATSRLSRNVGCGLPFLL